MKLTLFLACQFLFSKFSFAAPFEVNAATSKECSQIGVTSNTSHLIHTKSIEVAALGRFADLGDLYDARRDQFLDISLYKTDLSGDAIHSTDNTYSAIDYVRTESLSEKMEKLGVQTGLAISFLSGLVTVSGSGKYLEEEKKSFKSAKTSLIYSTRTMRDELKVFSKTSRSIIDTFLLENIDATHVVVGIDWGANVVLSLEETKVDSSEIQRKLEAAVKLAVLSVSASVKVDFGTLDVEKSSTFSLHLNGDIIPNAVPQTINESIAFIRDIPNLIKNENGGKGKIMNYVLMPLSTVQKVFKVDNSGTNPLKSIDQELVNQFMRISQEMKDSHLQINDAYNSFNTWKYMVPENEFTEISEMKSKFSSFTHDLRAKFADLIVKYRSGDIDEKPLIDLISSYKNSSWTAASISSVLKAFSPTSRKTELLNILRSLNPLFIDRRTDKSKILANSYHREIGIISANLSMNISSPHVYRIIKLLNVESGEKSGAISYYIEDAAVSVPVVKVYLQANVLRSFSFEKKEYVLLADSNGNVIIMDSDSLEKITAYKLPEIQNSTVAVIGDTFYNIDTTGGNITSTSIGNIMMPTNVVKWTQVGSFPSEPYSIRNSAAVNQTMIYFVTHNGILYKYDSVSKTVTKCASLKQGDYYASSIIVNDILYIHKYDKFYSFDGITIKEITTSETRQHPGLFQFGNKICRVGGNVTDEYPDPVGCYSPKDETWTVMSHINEARRETAVVGIKSKTYIFGGYHFSTYRFLNTVEVLNHDTRIWSYAPSPITTTPAVCQAVIINF